MSQSQRLGRSQRKHCVQIGGKLSIGRKNRLMKQLLMPQILAAAMLLGMFHWTNYWDFVIYYVMGGMGVIWCNYQKYKELEKPHRMRMTAGISLLHAV